MCILESPGRITRAILEGVTTREVLTSSRKDGSVVDRTKKWQQMVQFDGMNSEIRDLGEEEQTKIQRWP